MQATVGILQQMSSVTRVTVDNNITVCTENGGMRRISRSRIGLKHGRKKLQLKNQDFRSGMSSAKRGMLT